MSTFPKEYDTHGWERHKRLAEKAFGRWDPPWPRADDDDAWEKLRIQAFANLKSNEAREIYDHMKRLRAERRMYAAQDAGERARERALAPGVLDWINRSFATLEADCDYVDNRRWADITKRSQVRRFVMQRERGCCGSMNEKLVCPIDGKTYLIGFNYGH